MYPHDPRGLDPPTGMTYGLPPANLEWNIVGRGNVCKVLIITICELSANSQHAVINTCTYAHNYVTKCIDHNNC